MTLSPKDKTRIFQERTLIFAKEIDSQIKTLPISFQQYCQEIINKSSKFFERIWAILYPFDKDTQNIYIQMVDEMNIFQVKESASFNDLKKYIVSINKFYEEQLNHFSNYQMITFSLHETEFKQFLSTIGNEEQKEIIAQKLKLFLSKTKRVGSNKEVIEYVKETWKNKEKYHFSSSFEILKQKYQWKSLLDGNDLENSKNQLHQLQISGSCSINSDDSKKPKTPSSLSTENNVSMVLRKPAKSFDSDLATVQIESASSKTTMNLVTPSQLQSINPSQNQNNAFITNKTNEKETNQQIDLSAMSSYHPNLSGIDSSRESEAISQIKFQNIPIQQTVQMNQNQQKEMKEDNSKTMEFEIQYMEEENDNKPDEIETLIETINNKLISNYKFTNSSLTTEILRQLHSFL